MQRACSARTAPAQQPRVIGGKACALSCQRPSRLVVSSLFPLARGAWQAAQLKSLSPLRPVAFHYPKLLSPPSPQPHTSLPDALVIRHYQPALHTQLADKLRPDATSPQRALTPAAPFSVARPALSRLPSSLALCAPLSSGEGHLLHMGDSGSVIDMTAPGVGKTEDPRDGSTSSIASSPEPEPAAYTQDNPQQQQKRKGGRKPVSTSPIAPSPPWPP